MAKWVLTVHVGHYGKKSKTELMLFPSTKNLNEWREVPIDVNVERDDSESEGQYQISKKKNKFVVNLIAKMTMHQRPKESLWMRNADRLILLNRLHV